VNSLLQLRPLSHGLPIAFANRGDIAQEKFEDAARFVRQVRMASGQAYNIVGPDKVESYECSVAGATKMALGKSCLTHTNHPLVSDDFGWHGKNWKKEEASPRGNSETRYRYAAERITTENHPQSYCEPYWELTITMFTPYAVTSLRKHPITMQQTLYTSWQSPPRCT
jgi:hypothetical protein